MYDTAQKSIDRPTSVIMLPQNFQKQMNVLIGSDVDECTDESDNCDDNAECTNTLGGFICNCTAGYTGTGQMCSGESKLVYSVSNSIRITVELLSTWLLKIFLSKLLRIKFWKRFNIYD